MDHEAHEFEEQVADDAVIKRLFELITVSTPATFERRSATRDELISKGISDQLLSVAIDKRLLEEVPHDQGSEIQLSHDLLLDAWPALNRWTRQQRPRQEFRWTLIEDAKRWDRGGRRDHHLRISTNTEPWFNDPSLTADLAADVRSKVEDYVKLALSKIARQRLVAAVNAGRPEEIRRAIRDGAQLTEEQRGDGVWELRPQFWAAVTGDDRRDEDRYADDDREGMGPRRSIFEDSSLVNSCVTRGLSVAHIAALSGQASFLKRLIRDYGADPRQLTERGGTILSHAAYGGVKEACRFLIEDCGIRADLPDSDGSSAAFWAAQQGYNDLAQYLADCGSPLDLRVTGGWNRLTEAVRSGHIGSVKAAISAGFLVNQPTDLGITPALVACRHLHPEILECLIKEYDADVTIPDNDGRTAYDHLLSGIPDVPQAQRMDRAESIIKILLAQGLPADLKGVGNERVLIHAIDAGAVELITALLRHGSEIRGAPPRFVIPLLRAAEVGQHSAAESLMAAGADGVWLSSWTLTSSRANSHP